MKKMNGSKMETDYLGKHASLMTIAFSVMVTNIFGTFKLAVEEIERECAETERKK